MIRGERVFLRAVEPDDLSAFQGWRNELMRSFRQWRVLGSADQDAWYRSLEGNQHHLMFSVCDYEGVLLGCCGLTYIDWVQRRAEAALYIGNELNRRKGYGRDALRALLRYGFDTLGLHRVTAEVFEFNEPSLRLFEGVGFQREGVLRAHHFDSGRWWDSVLFGLLAEEWRKA